MVALFLVMALVTPAGRTHAVARAPLGYVVQFCAHANAAETARELVRLQAAGLKDVRTLTSPLAGKRHVYRVVSRRFETLAEARLALVEARRVLSESRIPFHGVILHGDVAGVPLIR